MQEREVGQEVKNKQPAQELRRSLLAAVVPLASRGGAIVLASSVNRVPSNTARHINQQIRHQTEANIARYATAGPEAIDRRLAELDEEWDIERYLETMAPTFSLLGLTLGVIVNRKWLIVPFVVQTFFLQHALQGWCPPVPVLRRLGVRTAFEIDEERYALKALRGDFQGIQGTSGTVGEAIEAARH